MNPASPAPLQRLTRDSRPMWVTRAVLHPLRFALSAMDMEQKDYDSRTALHVAAAEGI